MNGADSTRAQGIPTASERVGRAADAALIITGCPRSGTNLLAQMLYRRFGIAFPFETHFLPNFWRFRWMWGDLSRHRNRARLLSAIYGYVHIWIRWGARDMDRDGLRAASLLSTRDRASEILAGSHDFASLVAGLYRSYADLRGARRWGDKSVYFKPPALDALEVVLPGLKVIHLLRDGRDVTLSWRRTWFGPKTIEEAAQLWQNHVRTARDWGRRHPDHFLELRYEDLIADPNGAATELAAFVGATRGEASATSGPDELSAAMARSHDHALLAGPIIPDNQGKWRTDMTPGEVARFEAIAHTGLARAGYAPSHETVPGWRRKLAWITLAAAALSRPFSPVAILRAGLEILPAVLLITSRGRGPGNDDRRP